MLFSPKTTDDLLQKISPSYYFTILSMTTVTQDQLRRHMKCLGLLSETFSIVTLIRAQLQILVAPRLRSTPNPSRCIPSLHRTFAPLDTYNTKCDTQASRGAASTCLCCCHLGIFPVLPANLNLGRKRAVDRLSVISAS